MSNTSDKTKIRGDSTAEEIISFYNVNLKGKVVIVTGSNSGIGLETARVLSKAGAKVIIPCRTIEKANGAISHIKETVPYADLVPMQLDLSDTAIIRDFAKSFLALDLPLHILINNAGIMACPKSFTADGFETQFGVNHLGHFLLVQLLTDKLKQSAPSRIINLSSCGNRFYTNSNGMDFEYLSGEKNYSPYLSYGQSKLANILHAKELQRRFDAEGVDITVVSLNPGNVESNLVRHGNVSSLIDGLSHLRNYKLVYREIVNRKKVTVGASTSVLCAVSPEIVKGEFYSDNDINKDFLNEQANNEDMAKKLWEVSEQMLSGTA